MNHREHQENSGKKAWKRKLWFLLSNLVTKNIILKFRILLPSHLCALRLHYLFVVLPKIINPLIKIVKACSEKSIELFLSVQQ
jgi:hypothetical protein